MALSAAGGLRPTTPSSTTSPYNCNPAPAVLLLTPSKRQAARSSSSSTSGRSTAGCRRLLRPSGRPTIRAEGAAPIRAAAENTSGNGLLRAGPATHGPPLGAAAAAARAAGVGVAARVAGGAGAGGAGRAAVGARLGLLGAATGGASSASSGNSMTADRSGAGAATSATAPSSTRRLQVLCRFREGDGSSSGSSGASTAAAAAAAGSDNGEAVPLLAGGQQHGATAADADAVAAGAGGGAGNGGGAGVAEGAGAGVGGGEGGGEVPPSALHGQALLDAAPATPIILAQGLEEQVAEVIARWVVGQGGWAGWLVPIPSHTHHAPGSHPSPTQLTATGR